MFSWVTVVFSKLLHIYYKSNGKWQTSKGKLTSQTFLVHKHLGLMHLEVYFMGKKSFIWRFPVLLHFSSIKSNKTAVVVVFWVIPACSLSWDWDVYIIAQEWEHTDARHLTLPRSAKSPRTEGWPMAPSSLGVPSQQHFFLEKEALTEAIYVLLYVVLIQKKKKCPSKPTRLT